MIRDTKDKSDFIEPLKGFYTRTDTGNQGNYGAVLVKVKPGTDAVVEGRLYKELSNLLRGTSVDILHLDNLRQGKNTQTIGPMIILSVVAGFLIINVALGLFGVLWYNISKRRSEIGLRRAVGATANSISMQLVGEAMVLSTVSLAAGVFFAIQFPLLHVFDIPAGTYLIAMTMAVLFIYLLVTICAFYPGKQAAAVYPAVALHED
ncbi:MAG: transporter permease [Chitinophagaceae bacterium]|nr:transporter permease [Chitinophagaceae bacterium]